MGVRELNLFLSDVSDLSEIIPLIAVVLARHIKPPHHLWRWFFIGSALTKICTLVLAKQQQNNMPLFHFLALWEVAFLYIIYNFILFGKVRWIPLLIVLGVNVTNSLLYENLYSFNGLAWSLNTIILLSLGIWTFSKLVQKAEDLPEKNPTFVINAGWMIYFSGALFTYILGSSILSTATRDFFHNAWIIQSASNISKNIIVAIGIWIASQHLTTSSR